jgi:hypothetical protein
VKGSSLRIRLFLTLDTAGVEVMAIHRAELPSSAARRFVNSFAVDSVCEVSLNVARLTIPRVTFVVRFLLCMRTRGFAASPFAARPLACIGAIRDSPLWLPGCYRLFPSFLAFSARWI